MDGFIIQKKESGSNVLEFRWNVPGLLRGLTVMAYVDLTPCHTCYWQGGTPGGLGIIDEDLYRSVLSPEQVLEAKKRQNHHHHTSIAKCVELFAPPLPLQSFPLAPASDALDEEPENSTAPVTTIWEPLHGDTLEGYDPATLVTRTELLQALRTPETSPHARAIAPRDPRRGVHRVIDWASRQWDWIDENVAPLANRVSGTLNQIKRGRPSQDRTSRRNDSTGYLSL